MKKVKIFYCKFFVLKNGILQTYMARRWGERNIVNQAGKKKVEATFFNNDRSYKIMAVRSIDFDTV